MASYDVAYIVCWSPAWRICNSRLSLTSSSRFRSKCFTHDPGHAFSYSFFKFRAVRLAPELSRHAKYASRACERVGDRGGALSET